VTPSPPPKLFRTLLPALDLTASRRFYERLLGSRGRLVAPGRVYFDAGPAILGLLEYSQVSEAKRPKPVESVYLSTGDLDGVFRRAERLHCLDPSLLHEDPRQPAGRPVRRPWGERSFYALDPAGNSLCFVDVKTRFTGTASQMAAHRRSSSR
jgi:catechol 2,3-dioxygenase-like lactoylglutathione lyase family enzyme